MTSNYDKQIFKQLQDVLKKCDNLSQEVRKLKKENKKDTQHLEIKIDKLEEENEKLKKENKLLKDENDRLKGIINKDSTNSSIPPSKDEQCKRRNINLREKTNKKSGGQKGHKGATFTKEDVEQLLEKKM